MQFTLHQIGAVHCGADGFSVVIEPEYRAALQGLAGFSYVQILWWFDRCDSPAQRAVLACKKPYTNGPETMGVFATRSPQRPNPIAVSPAYVTHIDMESGVIGLAWIDAMEGTPMIDIKPYTPSVDRVEHPTVPDWCAHWPKCVEESGDFNLESEFNF